MDYTYRKHTLTANEIESATGLVPDGVLNVPELAVVISFTTALDANELQALDTYMSGIDFERWTP